MSKDVVSKSEYLHDQKQNRCHINSPFSSFSSTSSLAGYQLSLVLSAHGVSPNKRLRLVPLQNRHIFPPRANFARAHRPCTSQTMNPHPNPNTTGGQGGGSGIGSSYVPRRASAGMNNGSIGRPSPLPAPFPPMPMASSNPFGRPPGGQSFQPRPGFGVSGQGGQGVQGVQGVQAAQGGQGIQGGQGGRNALPIGMGGVGGIGMPPFPGNGAAGAGQYGQPPRPNALNASNVASGPGQGPSPSSFPPFPPPGHSSRRSIQTTTPIPASRLSTTSTASHTAPPPSVPPPSIATSHNHNPAHGSNAANESRQPEDGLPGGTNGHRSVPALGAATTTTTITPTPAPTSSVKHFRPYFTPAEIVRMSAKQRGKLSVSREERVRQQACGFIDAVGARCGL